jgi:hypothetical protein
MRRFLALAQKKGIRLSVVPTLSTALRLYHKSAIGCGIRAAASKADPSTPLRFAQDDKETGNFVVRGSHPFDCAQGRLYRKSAIG